MYDETLRELKEVRYISSMTKNIVVLKSIRRNNLYYLMSSTVTDWRLQDSWMAIPPDHDTVDSDKLA